MGALIFVLPGALFGAGLALSGMTNPAKVKGFLDLTGDWDPSLVLVMGGGLASFALWNLLLGGRAEPILGGAKPTKPNGKVDARLIVGSMLFGVGWGLAGLCPGPAIANLGVARTEALVFVPAMVGGMWIAQRLLGADRDIAPDKPLAR
ncbi:MAG TPA: DUF6691 family protein [Acidobacteriota bacterium]|nr:DUF6691 family protein [Acidobacteriota bacterium]